VKSVRVLEGCYRFVFDSGMLFVVSEGVLFREGVLNPDLIIGDEEFRELNDFFRGVYMYDKEVEVRYKSGKG